MYELIMRDKESLLSFASDSDAEDTRRKRQVAFIFRIRPCARAGITPIFFRSAH